MNTDQNEFNEQGDSQGEQSGETFNAADEGLIVAEERQPANRSTLVMFAILVVGAAGLYFMYRQSGPKSAAAANIAAATEAKKTITSFLASGDANFKSMEARLKYTEKIVQQFKTYPSATQVPLSDLATNPFRQHVQKVIVPADTGNPGLDEAAEKKRREEERLTIKKAAEGLQVQSIMCSETRKACMINNTLYREGQEVNGFNVEKISPSAVIVKNGPYRFELRMQR